MSTKNFKKNKLLLILLWIVEGAAVGFGAILPGISGGTLSVVFGMYFPLIETLSSPKTGIKKHGLMLGVFMLGFAIGFIGLSGLTATLLEKNTTAVTCAFVGFILGTFPSLWKDAGAEGRKTSSYVSLVLCFLVMLGALTLLKTKLDLRIEPSLGAYLFCGMLWGLSFVIPGLSSSSLLLFFGLYQPMLAGISTLNMSVLLPMGAGTLACVLLLSRAVDAAYKKQYSLVSHGVLGIVAATVLMIMPFNVGSVSQGLINLLYIVGGAVVSFVLSNICDRLKAQVE